MNLQQLRYVRALVEEKSFVAAAARCSVTQPTLSNGIAQLETELGQRIFRRTTRSLSLTPVGERLLPAVLETLKSFDKIKELASQARPGQRCVHVGFSPVVGIAQAEESLKAFRKKCPDVEIVYREGNLQAISESLKSGDLDLVMAPLNLEACQLSNCVYRLLCSEPLMFVPKKSDATRWRNRTQVRLDEIAEDTFVLVPNVCGLTQVTRQHFEKASLRLRRYPGEASSYATVEEWAGLSLGSAILPASKVANGMNGVDPIAIVENGKPLTIDYYALGKPNTASPAIFAELWSMLQQFNPVVAAAKNPDADYVLDWAV